MTAIRSLLLACIVALSCPGMSISKDSGGLRSSSNTDENKLMAGFGAEECVRYSDWTPTRTVESCDPLSEVSEIAPSAIASNRNQNTTDTSTRSGAIGEPYFLMTGAQRLNGNPESR
jgi:hypothetical protein